MFTVDPIGYFHTISHARYQVPRQPSSDLPNEGVIVLKSHHHFEQALEGVEGFERLWILFRFHQATHWKPKVMPPRGRKKRGVFATRAPHRPNFMGLSCVQLVDIKGLKLFVVNHDLIDGTPILDIKPYLSYADAFLNQKQGWVDTLPPETKWQIEWSELAEKQVHFLKEWGELQLKEMINKRLQISPFPYANNRVRQEAGERYTLAYQTWRVSYTIHTASIQIERLFSGYDESTLKGEKSSKWEDVFIHQAFVNKDDFLTTEKFLL